VQAAACRALGSKFARGYYGRNNRQPSTNLVINYVTKLVPSPRCIIGGDFNVHYDFFKPGVNTFLCRGELVK
jgi:hypothetical protein